MSKVTNPFLCRDCGLPSQVLATRGDGDTTRRFRKCPNDHRFVTREVFDRDVRANKPYSDGRGRQKATA